MCKVMCRGEVRMRTSIADHEMVDYFKKSRRSRDRCYMTGKNY
jgi:hypothetical protein